MPPIRVKIPIQFRFTPEDLLGEGATALIGATHSGVSKVLRLAGDEALLPRGDQVTATPSPPTFAWRGDALNELSLEARRAFEERVAETIQRLVAELPKLARAGVNGAPSRRQDTAAKRRPQGVTFLFTIQLDPESRNLSADDLLLEFIRQYRRLSTIEEARAMRDRQAWGWIGSAPVITVGDIRRGFIQIPVTDLSLSVSSAGERRSQRAYFIGLDPAEQAGLNEETDRRFSERTQARVGQARSRGDRVNARYWEMLRDDLVRQRQAILALPQEIRDVLFTANAGRVLEPRDYDTALRIAARLQTLTPAEREAYLLRTLGSTTDLSVFENSVERYLGLVQRQRAAATQREITKSAFFELDAVYNEYRRYVDMARSVRGRAAFGGEGGTAAAFGLLPSLQVQDEMREHLLATLRANEFDSIEAFEAAIRAFERAFRDEAVLIARDLLDRYEHTLLAEETLYGRDEVVRGLNNALAPARARYAGAYSIREQEAQSPWTADEMAAQTDAAGRFRREMEAGAAAVARLATDHPLVTRPGFPVEELATTADNIGAVRGVMLRFVRARLSNVRETRRNLADDAGADLVWRLPALVAAAKQAQSIAPNSVPDKIIRHHVNDRAFDEAIINLATAVIAIALGIVTAGGGTVAVLAATASFGISAWQAWDEFRRYEIGTAAYGAGLASDDPSLVWVVIAIAGAGVDAAGIAASLRSMRGAVSAFNRSRGAASDVAALERELEQLRRLDQITERVKDSVLRAARAEAEAEATWDAARASFVGIRGYIDPIITPLAHMAVHFAYPMWLSLRRSVIGIEQFLRMNEMVALIGDTARLSPAGLARVRQTYAASLQQVQRIANRGAALGMLDNEIERLLLVWNRTPDLSADDLIRQIEQWAEPLAARANARARMAPDLILDPQSRALLPDFEHRIAGTGGIERITVRRPPEGGRIAVTIEGEILPGRLARDPADVTPTIRRAPDFNRSGQLFSRAEAGLPSGRWQRLHLWGPGFGDEAAAGMMWGPTRINLDWQNESIEQYIRDLARQANQDGARVRVRATAVSWEDPLPSGWRAPQGDNFLKEAEYRITIIRPGEPEVPIRIHLELEPPPGTGVRHFSVEPPGAVNLGDALRLRGRPPGTSQ